ncbi:hypothetical protein [uncultured Cohaesibacter sp.]|uniref:hypothetical protein n=1 Tax=uncultured Cohaesibacter sp. TaxID=1002546 RepID=UPI00292D577B|nr:hypothetical protein [uncultured Cohaesibacter sp.]
MEATADQNPDLRRQADTIIQQIDRWRRETFAYRWLNIILFMSCKALIPAGSLVVAANLTATLFATAFFDNLTSTIIAIVVTVLATLEVMLNPSAKKRVAFTLNNELTGLKNNIQIELATGDSAGIKAALTDANTKLRDLLNKYSQDGY